MNIAVGIQSYGYIRILYNNLLTIVVRCVN